MAHQQPAPRTPCSTHFITRSVCAVVLVAAVATASLGRTWTSENGKAIEAEFVKFADNGASIVLDMDGKRFNVPLNRLSPADRDYLKGLKASLKGEGKDLSDAQIDEKVDDAIQDDKKTTPSENADQQALLRSLRGKRVWTDRNGISVEARFVRFVYGTLVLNDPPRYHKVPFYDLSLKDRQFLHDCYVAMGKAEEIPPVREELLNLAEGTVESSSEEESPEMTESGTKDGPPTSGSGTSPSADNSGETLPPDGFGSDSGPETNAGSDESLPPSGFGVADNPGTSGEQLPASGFGSDETNDPSTASNSSEAGERLPESGFGNLASSEQTSNDDVFQDNDGKTLPNGRKHVKIPESTIVRSKDSPGTSSDLNDIPL